MILFTPEQMREASTSTRRLTRRPIGGCAIVKNWRVSSFLMFPGPSPIRICRHQKGRHATNQTINATVISGNQKLVSSAPRRAGILSSSPKYPSRSLLTLTASPRKPSLSHFPLFFHFGAVPRAVNFRATRHLPVIGAPQGRLRRDSAKLARLVFPIALGFLPDREFLAARKGATQQSKK